MAKSKSTEVMVITPQLQKNIDILLSVKQSVEETVNNCMQIQITDDTSLAVAQQNLSKVNSLLTSTKNKIKAIRDPYNAELKQIGNIGSTLTDPLEMAVKHLKTNVETWETQRLAEAAAKQLEIDRQLAEKAEAERKETERKETIRAYIRDKATPLLQKIYSECTSVEICDDKLKTIVKNYKPIEWFQEFGAEAYELRDNYINLIKTKREQLASAATMSEAEIELALEKEAIAVQKANMSLREAELKAKEEAAENEKKAKEASEAAELEKQRLAQEAEMNKTKGVRYTWAHELHDIKSVPLDWLTLDDAKIKEWLKENKDSLKDGEIQDGVRFFKKMGIAS